MIPDGRRSITSMATQTPTQRRTAAKKAAATRKRNAARRSQSARTAAATRAQAEATALEALAQQAERAVLIPVGAALTARDNVLDAAKPFTRRETAERELSRLQRQVTSDLRKFERRGATARTRLQRQVK